MEMIISRNPTLPLTALLLIALLVPTTTQADQKKPVLTTITVGEMCSGCVKKITARLEQEKSIAKIKCDIPTKTVTLAPADNVRFSPKKLWEIMESIGKKPKKLVGPNGTFTSKP